MKNVTTKKTITEIVKTFEDALAYNGETAEQFAHRTQFDSPDDIAIKKVKVICLALNEGEVLQYDGKRWLYYPWFDVTGSGSGFSFYDCYYGYSHSSVGSRLCLKSSELAEYAGKQFTSEFEAALNK